MESAQDKSFDSFLGFMTQEDGAEHWKLPTEGTVKVNTDAHDYQKMFSIMLLTVIYPV